MRKVNEIREKINRIKGSNHISRLSKFSLKMINNQVKYHFKQIADIELIKKEMGEIEKWTNLYLFSRDFDSPNLLLYLHERYEIESAFISTWAITDRGLYAISVLDKAKVPVKLLLDKTYSYKWIFSSGAADYLENVDFRFTENHSKMMLIKTKCGLFINVIGSMNLSNNPRFENINVVENEGIYNFYLECVESIFYGESYRQGVLFVS